MFSFEMEQQIEGEFERLLPLVGNRREAILCGLGELPAQEAIVMKFLYTKMTLSDAGNYSFDIFLDYARHGIFLWNRGNYKDKLPLELFLNYVLYHRVNEEEITQCRSFFYQQLSGRVEGLGMKEAVLEVNYWCAEEVTYHSTDERTMAPMAVYKTGYGRCGEESAFTVSALRSIGIPARQVYVPRWSHCDDNHAWVEAWCDGTWYFIGACEPEPVLNRGWFTNASSRAMLAHSRWFGGIPSGEEITERDGMAAVFNTLSHYGRTREVEVQIIDKAGKPVEAAEVEFEVLNYAEFFPVAALLTDPAGKVRITLGLGSIHLHAHKDGQLADRTIDTREKGDFIICLGEDRRENAWIDFDIIAPEEQPVNISALTKEQELSGVRRMREAIGKRLAKMEAACAGTRAKERILKDQAGKGLEEILKKSISNYGELGKFLLEEPEGARQDKEALLGVLSEKDYRDCKGSVLWEHFRDAIKYAGQLERGIFIHYVLNPRIYFEPLTQYREFINGFYTEGQKQLFREKPALIWEDIHGKIKEYPEREYSHLVTTPAACLSMGAGSLLSKKILFVAVCRTLGIPARIKDEDLSIEYYGEGQFKPVGNPDTATAALKLQPAKEGESWIYFTNWSLAVLEGESYRSLKLAKEEWEQEGMELRLMPGNYRIITTKRLLNGNLFAKEYYFTLQEGERKEVCLQSRDIKLRDMLTRYPLPDFEVTGEEGEAIGARDLVRSRMNLFIWLEEGKEPTEHILNELYEHKEAFQELDGGIFFMVRDRAAPENPTIKRTLSAIPGIRTCYDATDENAERISRRMYVEPGKLPLILVTDQLSGIYAVNGYNVGTADLLLRIFAEHR
ncbi:MAG TPA: transglutaminase domain-containing protein [Clostridiales bacterium]|nr:transglutaminase domain-containing protein [Clostridiales bacterium]